MPKLSFSEFFNPPDGSIIYRSRTSEAFMNSSGVLITRHFQVATPITPEEMRVAMEQLKSIAGSNKIYIISNIDYSLPASKEARDIAAVALPPLVGAMALVCSRPLARMGAKIFFGLKPQPYPNKVFDNPFDAEAWILSLQEKWQKING